MNKKWELYNKHRAKRSALRKKLYDQEGAVSEIYFSLLLNSNIVEGEVTEKNKGLQLFFDNTVDKLTRKGYKVVCPNIGDEFNLDLHEAVAVDRTCSPELYGRVTKVIEKGLIKGNRMVKYSKVLIGDERSIN